MRTEILTALLASLITPALSIPPPSFGFPEAPNDTALVVSFPQASGQNVPVTEAELFGIDIPAQMPLLGVNTSAYRSLADYNGEYTVIMVDPDASYPENPTKRFYLHWLQASLAQASNTSDLGHQLVNKSVPVVPSVPYTRPAPPTNSSAHRYILYAFQQPANFVIPEQWSKLGANNRTSFNLTQYISDANLGTPAAANYFYVSNQSNVPRDFVAAAGSQYPGGDGTAVTSGDPYKPTTSSSSGSGTSSSSAEAAMMTGVGALLGAGLVGCIALL